MFVEFADKLKQVDNDIKSDFYDTVRNSYLYDLHQDKDSDINIDMLQKEKNYFYNPIDNSISSVDKQSDNIKVEFDEDYVLKSSVLPSIAIKLSNNENILKRNMMEFHQKITQNNEESLDYNLKTRKQKI